MAAHNGPVPPDARLRRPLIRVARRLREYGIAAREPALDHGKLLERVRSVDPKRNKWSRFAFLRVPLCAL